MKLIYTIPLCISLFFITFSPTNSQIFIKGGANYSIPMNHLADINKPAIGWNVQVQNGMNCRWWYGIKFSAAQYKEKENLLPTVNYYTSANYIEPMVRYNFVSKNCRSYKKKLIPYLEICGIISSMENTDNEENLGFGGSGGAGLFYTGNWLKHCWIIDLKCDWIAPNALLNAESRSSVQLIDVSLNIGVSL